LEKSVRESIVVGRNTAVSGGCSKSTPHHPADLHAKKRSVPKSLASKSPHKSIILPGSLKSPYHH